MLGSEIVAPVSSHFFDKLGETRCGALVEFMYGYLQLRGGMAKHRLLDVADRALELDCGAHVYGKVRGGCWWGKAGGGGVFVGGGGGWGLPKARGSCSVWGIKG